MRHLYSFLIIAFLLSCKNDVNDLEFGFTINNTNDWIQVGDKLITNFENMYNLHINHEPEDNDYPYKGWFFGWVKDQCNEGYAGCDAIYASKSKSLTFTVKYLRSFLSMDSFFSNSFIIFPLPLILKCI